MITEFFDNTRSAVSRFFIANQHCRPARLSALANTVRVFAGIVRSVVKTNVERLESEFIMSLESVVAAFKVLAKNALSVAMIRNNFVGSNMDAP